MDYRIKKIISRLWWVVIIVAAILIWMEVSKEVPETGSTADPAGDSRN